ncbi:MAG: class I SAM-dependent methyltransferase [Chloroflexi bacterium]|nr:MAG: class I SAM-dependent methyltransferase [Chloroflexota bacterium]MBL1196220.1 class I SAM-dependent methyltransferase [Chloroflexota bacterium]NOH13514.1 class I SAM-dependent methyltransferase [Chloroflexota bacterium]
MRTILDMISQVVNNFGMWVRIILGSRHMLRFRSMTNEERFTKIYDENMWGDTESLSGTLSSMEGAAPIREQLPAFIEDLQVGTFLDVPCGDFNWMNDMDLPVKKYIGADIVRSMIDANRRQYANEDREFIYLDVMNEALPQADLIFCRECFIHFSNQDIQRTLNNFRQSDATYLLTTTHPELKKNVDIETGFWRPINLQAAPFHLPPPLKLLTEYANSNGVLGKSMGLWHISDLGIERD